MSVQRVKEELRFFRVRKITAPTAARRWTEVLIDGAEHV